jgi:hypothetical protein
MNLIKSLSVGAGLLLSIGTLLAGPIHFAQSDGGAIVVNGSDYNTISNSPLLQPSTMMGFRFDGTLGAPSNEAADIFGDQGQFRFELNTATGVDIFDAAYPALGVAAGSATWAIQNVQGMNVVNSLFRGTVNSISLNQTTGLFSATLATDGYIHWYYGTGVTAMSSWGLDGLIYVTGNLIQSESNPAVFHNNVPDNTLQFSFGVPDSGTTALLIGLALLGLGATRRRLS